MGKQRRQHSGDFKAKVALEAIKGVQTVGELSSKYKVHSTVIGQWKRQLVNGAAEVFGRGSVRTTQVYRLCASATWQGWDGQVITTSQWGERVRRI